MKKANFNAGSAIGGFKRWFGGSMATMRSAWSLYRAVAGRTAVFAGVLLVLPYAVLIMLTMRAVSFDVGAGISMLTGVGYMGDWSRAIMGRLQAISSLSSLLSYATDLFLLPCACAAFAFLYWMRWQGLSLDVKDVWARVKPRVGRIVITGLMVMFISNLVQMVGSLANGLISMVAGLLGFIPVVGSIVYALAYIASLLIVIAIALISLTALMFAMLNMADEDNGYSQLIMSTLRFMWGGRRDVGPGLGFLMLMAVAALAVCAALYGIFYAIMGATSALIVILVMLALFACAAIPLACAFITVLYMNEHERNGGRTYIYTQHN